jgi:hypothetical protein
MSRFLKNTIALLAIIVALASCTKESIVYSDQDDSAVVRAFKSAGAGNDGDVIPGAAALPPSMPSTDADDAGEDGSTTSGNISDDDDDESDDDASVKRNAQNK